MKIQFCCGGNFLPGWDNHDRDVDITKPLPFGDASADFVFCEHGTEHISPADAWRFFKEVRRILKPGGVFRIAVPSIERVFMHADREYLEWMHKAGFGAPTREAAVENQICHHGHLTIWSIALLETCFKALGFSNTFVRQPGHSGHAELRNIEGHGKVIGERNNLIETIVVEATR